LISDDLLQETEREIRANRRVTIRELHHIIPEVSKTTIHEAVTKKNRVQKIVRTLGAQNVNERSQNETDGFRAEVSHALRAGHDFQDSIVTRDETWGFHHNPESKQQSLQWRHTHSPRTRAGADFHDSVIQKLVPRLNKCLDNAGDLVEK
jgi:hypothetical protein